MFVGQISKEFRVIFRQQEVMKTFLQYDGTEAVEGQWGTKRSTMALRKSANWIPYIQVWRERDCPGLCRDLYPVNPCPA